MRVLMLGWEFPPYITGGLGTACYGLTKALDRHGVHVRFVLPKPIRNDEATHVQLLAPGGAKRLRATLSEHGLPELAAGASHERELAARGRGGSGGAGTAAAASPFRRTEFIPVPSIGVGAYDRPETSDPILRRAAGEASGDASSGSAHSTADAGDPSRPTGARAAGDAAHPPSEPPTAGAGSYEIEEPEPVSGDYGTDLFADVERYATFALLVSLDGDFDVIHAHDWMTFPAGLAISAVTGKPLVVHVHSTEFDRSGEHVSQRIYDVERRAVHLADRVVAVSQLTKNVLCSRYGADEEAVEVVYNGVELEPGRVGMTGIQSKDKIVLYFGRITYQKGPEYFLRAAKRVLEFMDDVKFVVAGSGDQASRMIEMAAEMGIGHKVLFTGFLRGNDIKRVFALADLYVMPSVSEPFGIAPLEAMSHNVPVLISKSSGVSEVLTHALKVDFWDIDDMANKIIAVLRYPAISRVLRQHGAFEVRRLTWDGAAQRCEQIYRQVIDARAASATPSNA